LLKREELTGERIEQIVRDAREAGYHFFLSAEEREASLRQALARYAPGDEAWVFAYGSLMWNPAIEYAARRRAMLRAGAAPSASGCRSGAPRPSGPA
jgi:cation transport protein ChaC